MYYKQSAKLLKKVKETNTILLNCHRRPDADSVSSALAMYNFLTGLGKTVRVICPDPVPKALSFLPNFEKIETVDYEKFDFSIFDLFIVLDSGTWDVISDRPASTPPEKLVIAKIDHHDSQEKFEQISIVNDETSSTAEIVFYIFKDWGYKLTENVATCLFTGIAADTICFSIPLTGALTFKAAAELIEFGVDKNLIMDKLYNSVEMCLFKFYGEVLSKLEYDKDHHFAWSSVDYKTFEKYGKPANAKNSAANTFFAKVKDSNFGILILEERPGEVGVSFRSARKFDTSIIAESLGGGGHHDSSAAKIMGLSFEDAVTAVLKAARNHAKE